MASTHKSFVVSVFYRVMKPLVRIMLRNRITAGELHEVLRRLYVECASESSAPTQPPTPMRLSIMTGIPPAEIQRLQASSSLSAGRLDSHIDRVGRILATWHDNMEFTGPYGVPLELPLERVDGRPSFTDLALRAQVFDRSPADLLDELVRADAVEISPVSGFVRPLARSYLPEATNPAALEFMAAAFTDLAETLDFNLSDQHDKKRFERRAWTSLGVPRSRVDEFAAMVEDQGQQFLEGLDIWLTSAESKPTEDDTHAVVGVAMYYFERGQLAQ